MNPVQIKDGFGVISCKDHRAGNPGSTFEVNDKVRRMNRVPLVRELPPFTKGDQPSLSPPDKHAMILTGWGKKNI